MTLSPSFKTSAFEFGAHSNGGSVLEITAEGLDGCALFWSVVEVNYCLGEFGNIYLARAGVP